MHEASALVCGGSLLAAREIAEGRVDRAVNIAGGLHHAMADRAAGFCVYNDCAVAISWLLDHGFERIAYVDVDVHHGDGVQAAFYDDPRVLTISLHQHPMTLWPGTGWPGEYGEGHGAGYAVNVPLPPGTADSRLAAGVPRGRPVAAQRVPAADPASPSAASTPTSRTRWPTSGCPSTGTGTIYRAAARARRRVAGGKWLAVGGGGYGLFRVVPRSWTHLIATVLDRDVEPNRPLPAGWVAHTAGLTRQQLPTSMTDGRDTGYEPWTEGADRVDAAVLETRARSSRCTASTRTTPGTEHDRAPHRTETPAPPIGPTARPRPCRDGSGRTPSRATRGTGRPTSWPPTAASCTCARSCPATPRSWCDPREPVRPHPLPALLRSVPAHLAARPRAVHHRRPPLPGGVHLPARRRDHRRRAVRGPARRRRARRHDRDRGSDSAEVAFVVRDDHQGRGLGSILLEHLAAAARENGLRRFEAEVLVENHAMVRVFREAGYQVSRAFDEGVLHLEFDIDPTEQSLAVRDAREQRAEARSVHNVLHPRSVAVIGASTDPSKIGHAVLTNLLRGNFTGPVYPVNPEARSVRGRAGLRLGHRHPRRRGPGGRRRARAEASTRSWTPAWPRGSRRWW